MKKRPKIEITEASSGKRISFKKFKEQNRDELLKYAISKKDVLGRKILTKVQLEKAVESNLLREVSFQNGVFFIEKELMQYVKQLLRPLLKRFE